LVNNIYVIEFKCPNSGWELSGNDGTEVVFQTLADAKEAIERNFEKYPAEKDDPYPLKYRVAKFKRAD
jgi:hypothetical protein